MAAGEPFDFPGPQTPYSGERVSIGSRPFLMSGPCRPISSIINRLGDTHSERTVGLAEMPKQAFAVRVSTELTQ